MKIVWTNHAVQRCWERMELGHHEKDMDRFDAAIKKNIMNMVQVKGEQSPCIPFQVAGCRYLALIEKRNEALVIKTVIHVTKEQFSRITKKQEWI